MVVLKKEQQRMPHLNTEQPTLLETLVAHCDHKFNRWDEWLTDRIDAYRKVIVTQGMEKIIRESGHDSPINGPIDNL